MIDDPEDPLMLLATSELQSALGELLAPRPLDRAGVQRAAEIVDEHRAKWRRAGLDFPEMVPLVVPRVNAMRLLRRDLTAEELRGKVLQFLRDHQTVTAEEIAAAVAAAYPHMKGRTL